MILSHNGTQVKAMIKLIPRIHFQGMNLCQEAGDKVTIAGCIVSERQEITVKEGTEQVSNIH
jgi:hypothetical protein